jgi:ribosome biogenesis SPOUT family RNA methylase Rps3
LYWQFLFGIRRGSSHHYSITGTVIVYIVVVYNVELDEIFVISNVTVTTVPIIPYGNIIRGR